MRLGFYNNISHVNLNDYEFSKTWAVVDCPAIIHTTNLQGSAEKEVMVFFFKIRRKPLFYVINIIIPCVLLSLLSVSVFCLPAEAGEKTTICISILAALVVFFVLLTSIMPASAKQAPVLAEFLLFAFIVNLLSLVSSVVVRNFGTRTPRTHKLKRGTRKLFFHLLPRYLRSDVTHADDDDTSSNEHEIMMSSSRACCHHDDQIRGRSHTIGTPAERGSRVWRKWSKRDRKWSERDRKWEKEVNGAMQSVRFVANHMKAEDNYNEVR